MVDLDVVRLLAGLGVTAIATMTPTALVATIPTATTMTAATTTTIRAMITAETIALMERAAAQAASTAPLRNTTRPTPVTAILAGTPSPPTAGSRKVHPAHRAPSAHRLLRPHPIPCRPSLAIAAFTARRHNLSRRRRMTRRCRLPPSLMVVGEHCVL